MARPPTGVALLALSVGVHAGVAAEELTAKGIAISPGFVTNEESRKMVSPLRALIADSNLLRASGGNASDLSSQLSSSLMKVDQAGRVHVEVHTTDTSASVAATLAQHGMTLDLINADFSVFQGWISVGELEALARHDTVLRIRPPRYGFLQRASVTSQGDAIHRCDQARLTGLTGAGVKVGVISGGVSGLADSQAAGELPPNVQVLSTVDWNDEGTAMLEIVHDCAPDASLAFASAVSGDSITTFTLIQAVNALRDAGAHIIVDDIGVLDPYFEDGPSAQNDRIVGASRVRIASAGNYAQAHYQGAFNPGIFDPQIPGTRHNFGGGTLLRFRVLGGQSATLILQWGNRVGAAADDYDLCVRGTNGTLLFCSALVQNGNDDPLEGIQLVCNAPPGGSCAGDVQITKFAGASQALELFCVPSTCVFDQFNVRNNSIFGHQAVPEVLAVAAVKASQPGLLESFSSLGPVSILFPAPETRMKPDLAAVDGVSTSRPGFDPFFGTSAAAPHVAGVAALVMQALGPATNPATIRRILKTTALDLGLPGPDIEFGFGLVDALSALQSLSSSALVASVLPSSRSVAVGSTATAFATMIASPGAGATGCTIKPVTPVPGPFFYQATNPATNLPIGAPNAPVNIPGGGTQSFVFGFTPSASFAPMDVEVVFDCTNTAGAEVIAGVNTLLLAASSTPAPDIVALAAASGGVVNVPGTAGTGIFAVATVNLGAPGAITVTADTGSTSLPVQILLCQTNPITGACTSALGPSVIISPVGTGQTHTVGVFVKGVGFVPLDPGANRIFVRFKDAGGATRGSTSVAVRTQ